MKRPENVEGADATVYVYGLVDPKDQGDQVRGTPSRNPEKGRYSSHMSRGDARSMFSRWINSLRRKGQRARLVILEKCSMSDRLTSRQSGFLDTRTLRSIVIGARLCRYIE